jgi:hypothetical protein
MFLVNFGINLGLYFRLQDMEDRKVHGHSSKRTCPAGISIDHCFGIELSAVSIWNSQDHNDVVFTEFVNRFFDICLTLRVKGACSGSDEALGKNK